jgi:hypothetical protein
MAGRGQIRPIETRLVIGGITAIAPVGEPELFEDYPLSRYTPSYIDLAAQGKTHRPFIEIAIGCEHRRANRIEIRL